MYHSKNLGGGGGGECLYAQKQPFKTEFSSIMALQLFRNFSAQILLNSSVDNVIFQEPTN